MKYLFGTRKAEVLNSLIINTTAKAVVSFALAVVFIMKYLCYVLHH